MSAIGRVRMRLARRRRIPLHESSRQALLRVRIHNRQAPSVGDRCRTLSRLKKRSAAALATRLPGTDHLLDSALQLVLVKNVLDERVSYHLPLAMTYTNALTVLADPTRRKVFERLRAGPRPVNALAAGLPVSRPAVSQHLKALKDAGLVEERSEGVRRIYSLRREGLMELRDWLDTFWDDALAAFKEEVEKT